MKVDPVTQPKYPLDGVGPRHHVGAAAVGLMTLFLAAATLMPPAMPALAAPRHVAAATPSPSSSPSTSPSSKPSSAATTAPSSDADIKRVEAIVEKVEHLNPSLKDYTSDVAIEAKVKLTMLVLPLDLHGRSYHKAPDKYRFELQNAPSLLQKYQQVFGYRPIVLADFVPTMLADESVAGRPCYVVRLDKKGTSGDFRSQTVWIDKETFTSPRRLYLYKDNGKIDVNFKWRKEKDYVVIDTMDAQLEFPKVNGTATVKAQYQGYQFNTGLNDNIFTDNKVGGTPPPH